MQVYGPSGKTMPLTSAAQKGASANDGDFAKSLREAIHALNAEHARAEKAAIAFAEGKGGDFTKTVVALKKAELSFALAMAVRNKLLEAYREVMRMQV